MIFKSFTLLVLSLLISTVTSLASGKNYDSLFLARKNISAGRLTCVPKIDGIPNELCWADLPVADNFVQYSPVNGAKPAFQTKIRFGYDDDAFYISAIMFDPHPDSICTEMGKRDQVEILNTDYISFDILPYNDAQNMYEFKVTPVGLQNDAKYSAVGEDVGWDAVWESAAKITDSAWMVEARIPYSALRFPKSDQQVWGINMWRNLRRKNEWSTWSFVDNKVQDLFKYYGEVKGMDHISPPLRLSVTPYVAGYIQNNTASDKVTGLMRGGMDLRWGLNESYTVDMMLIPDFGQVESDDRVLNLTPFEIRYDEKRQFFTEGTEMFEKCGIFYSRRVGSMPRNYMQGYESLGSHEEVIANPEETRIINATKISGRNVKGLGMGFFNAMTTNTWAEIRDSSNGQTRKVLTQPFTNYNVAVLDQNLKNNSYLTFINTNYYSPEDHYMANVTGSETRITNKKGSFAVFGRMNVSNRWLPDEENKTGHAMTVSISKPSGKFQFAIERDHADKSYDHNDLGFLQNNNYASNALHLWHNIFQPKGHIVNMISRFSTIYNTLYESSKRKNLILEAANKTTYKNFWITHLVLTASPLGFRDYYEPRFWGKFYQIPSFYNLEGIVSTDSRKAFMLKCIFSGMIMPENEAYLKGLEVIPRMRFSDRFNISLDLSWSKADNDYGWVNTLNGTESDQTIVFGRRKVTTFSSVFSGRYVFTAKTSVTLRMRHYWSAVEYSGFYALLDNGKLTPSDYQGVHNINFNAFTADAQFVWYFAPGSEMSIVWKNTTDTFNSALTINYLDNLENTFRAPQTSSLSVRVLYYLDYQHIRKMVSAKQ